jgi:hypothetical protein
MQLVLTTKAQKLMRLPLRSKFVQNSEGRNVGSDKSAQGKYN